jgi:hypothetical protein
MPIMIYMFKNISKQVGKDLHVLKYERNVQRRPYMF